MADEKPTLDILDPPPKPQVPKSRRKRNFKIDRDQVTKFVIDGLNKDIEDRQERIYRRMDRRAKLMGWLPAKDYPWAGCANFWLPIMQIANLKTRGTLENAIKSVRPVMQSKAQQKRNAGKQESIDRLLDFQFFLENQGEKCIDAMVTNFVEDEAVFGFVQWVKETQTFHDTRILPAIPPDADIASSMLQALQVIFPTMLTQEMTDEDGWDWEVGYTDEQTQEPRAASVSFYELDDGKIQACLTKTATTSDGPCIFIDDFEDIVFPVRSANLQPPGPSNPRGAPYVNRLFTVSLDMIRRRAVDGTYDQMDADEDGEDWKKILGSRSVAGSGDDTDLPKEQKDELEGVIVSRETSREDREGVMHFGRFDVDGDGLEEDVIVWVLRDSKVLLKVALLTEIYPGLPIRRPLVCDSFIPIPNRIYGISQSELLESLQDCMQILMDQHVDWGTLTNTPMFFYRASSGMKAEPIYIEPGIGHPLDNPGQDIAFPTWPTKDSAFALNTIAVLQQFVERIQMFSDVSFGRVPSGKASALRTLGTTMSLLAQGDARAEQVLRRLFGVMSDIYELMHRLNRRYLPDGKEIRVIGMSEAGQDAYATVKPENIDAEIDFEFKATLINTNKQVLSANLSEVTALLISPLAVQAGIVTVEEIYRLMRDKCKALDLDPDIYLQRPAMTFSGPKLLAEEVISTLLADEMPVGQPMEMPEVHLQKLAEFMQSEAFGFLTPPQVQAFKIWTTKIQNAMMMQQQMMMAVQQQGTQQPGQNGSTPSGDSAKSTGTAENPPVQGSELIDESMSGEMPQ